MLELGERSFYCWNVCSFLPEDSHIPSLVHSADCTAVLLYPIRSLKLRLEICSATSSSTYSHKTWRSHAPTPNTYTERMHFMHKCLLHYTSYASVKSLTSTVYSQPSCGIYTGTFLLMYLCNKINVLFTST